MPTPSEQEEQWFKEQELKKKADELAAKAHQAGLAEREANKAASHMKCPKCNGNLSERTYEKVNIDQCADCGGIWLDKGELEQLTGDKAKGFFSWLSV